jgi:hypothetical protein
MELFTPNSTSHALEGAELPPTRKAVDDQYAVAGVVDAGNNTRLIGDTAAAAVVAVVRV